MIKISKSFSLREQRQLNLVICRLAIIDISLLRFYMSTTVVKTDRNFLSHPVNDWSLSMLIIEYLRGQDSRLTASFLNERNLRVRMTLYLQARRNRMHIKDNLDHNIPSSNLNHNNHLKTCNTTSTSMSTVNLDIQNLIIIMTSLKLTGITSTKLPRISTTSHMPSLVENGTSICDQ